MVLLQMHYETCPKFPEQCKNCKKENIKRDEASYFMPNKKVHCPIN